MNIFINIGMYQAIWFLCVVLENTGALLSMPLLALHLYLSPCKMDDTKLMVVFLVLGAIVDGVLHACGFMSYKVGAYPIPLWLAVIWLALATLPHHSLNWMKGRYILGALFGIVAGPLAYWGGVRLGAASFNHALIPSLIILALIWAMLWPLSLYIATRLRSPNVKIYAR